MHQNLTPYQAAYIAYLKALTAVAIRNAKA